MRRLVIILVIGTLCSRAIATKPFPPKVFANDSYAFVVAFAWPDEEGKVLLLRTVRKTSLLSMEDMGVDELAEWTTAGSRWYQNSIGYITSLQVRGMEKAAHHRVFYFRNKEGNETIIDLNTIERIDPKLVLNRLDLDKMTISEATSLIQSGRPHDRQTAAIHLGHLGNTEHVSALRKLLNDEASLTRISGKGRQTVYYVRDAAEKAIRLI